MPVDVTKHVGIGFPNLFDNVGTGSPSYVFSPGSPWDADFPLDNIFTRDFSEEARSTGITTGHTKFVVDNGAAVTARALVLIGNFSEDAQISWQRGSTPTGGAVASIALRDVWQFTPKVYDGRDHHAILVLPASASARYDYVQVTDTSNPDGILKLYRAGLFDLFVPGLNASYGLRHGFKTMSGAERSPGGGAFYAYKQRVLRTEQFVLEWLTNSEGDEIHELQRAADITEEVLYVPDVSDAAAQMRYGMLGALEELSGAELPRVNTRSVGFRVTQVA
jgi:hypothetical protein